MKCGVASFVTAFCWFAYGVCAASEEEFVNEWAVRIPGGEEHAHLVAREHGYDDVRKLMGFDDVYVFKKSDVSSREKREAEHHTRKLKDDFRVDWAEQQVIKRREKRGYRDFDQLPVDTREGKLKFNDPQWKDQWYLRSIHQCEVRVIDLNVEKAWDRNYTGRGVSVCVLDDGLEWNHTDLIQNYDPFASYDVNDNDNDPSPRYDFVGTNRHGSRCAGEISMMANNNKCGVGVAYNSKIGGVRMLDGSVTDTRESEAVGFNCTHVDIYSASWGPTDDGKTLDGPGRLTTTRMEECIRQGRNGLGVLYIWASGNGGVSGDNCGCDGYINSIYTIAINSISESGSLPWYGEMCAATMATTNSGGAFQDHRISTVDLHDECTNSHSGTSAAAPLAAGAFALVLEANPKLTWRDCQHILVCTSEIYQIYDNNNGWQKNGINLIFSQKFGFGVVNIFRMTKVAKTWVNVGKQNNCTIKFSPFQIQRMSSSIRQINVTFDGSQCAGEGPDKINYLEHVQFKIILNYSRRGAVGMYGKSPSNTVSYLLNPRVADKSVTGYNWTFMSVHFWGENPAGNWTFTIYDHTNEGNEGELIDAQLILRGSSEMPDYRKYGPTCGISKEFENDDVYCETQKQQQEPQKSWFQQLVNYFGNSGKFGK